MGNRNKASNMPDDLEKLSRHTAKLKYEAYFNGNDTAMKEYKKLGKDKEFHAAHDEYMKKVRQQGSY